MLNCFQYPRMSIRMTMSSPLDSRHGVQLNLGEQTMERSLQNLYAMNGGEGPNSYAQNSSYQREVVDVAKPIIEEEIAMKLDVKQLLSTNTKSFRIADFGCSTGHNSFPAMQIITEAVEKKFRTEGLNSQVPDFQVFFNDQVMNDFNTFSFHFHPKGVTTLQEFPVPFMAASCQRLPLILLIVLAPLTGSPKCQRQWQTIILQHGIMGKFTIQKPGRKFLKPIQPLCQ
ncbi:UNVERIFIED_CONTAM: Loganic acid O-methyltransferase [Sesamum angustifolium]|uniref:Loganic acid O-methyltransferase n=1 Tax=Sesamum angustifolium TaxID=2727405 RepID=A0AAW2M9C8_9LAMI